MRAHTPLFLTLIILVLVLQPVLAIDEALVPKDNVTIPPDDNQTRPPEPIDYQKKYNDILVELGSKEEVLATRSFDYEALVDNNLVTFYYDDGLFYPYPTDLLGLRPGHNPSYGEDEPYLGQVVDSYVNNDSVASTSNVVHNLSLGCMELEYNESVPAYENFTEWTEFNEGIDRVHIQNETLVIVDFTRLEDNRLTKDFGAKYFDTFDDYEFDFNFNSTDWDNNGKVWAILLSNYTGNAWVQYSAGNKLLTVIMSWDDGVYNIVVAEYDNPDATVTKGLTAFIADTWYFGKLILNNTHFSCEVYSDKSRTILIEEIAVTLALGKDNFRYCLISSLDTGADIDSSANLANYYLGGVCSRYLGGHYYTEEMVGGDQALNLMYNATIPSNTNMTLELSSDNSTWVNHNNLAGFEGLVAGLESLDLRDLNATSLYIRVNMTSVIGLDTPRMYQLRLVTVTSVVTASTAPYLAMAIILLMLGLVLGMRMRR